MKVVVVGGGSWGTGFSCVLRHRDHDVTLACRDAEQAREIAETGRNPRYLQTADLRGVSATTVDQAPIADADLVVLAVPSRACAEVAAGLPGDAPGSSLRKGLDQRTGHGLSDHLSCG